MINVISQSRYKVDKQKIIKVVEQVLFKTKGGSFIDLNIVFVGRRKMKSLANAYKNEDVALPVLSFPYHEDSDDIQTSEPNVAGDVVLCFPQAVLLAAEKDKSLDNMINDLVIHGVENIINN